MYELTVIDDPIKLEKDNSISIVGYDKILEQLDELGEYLCSVEVTEDNIKENRKLVAQVRKAVNKLNKRKIEFKKEYMKPLNLMYEQVKEIDRRATGYEEQVRTQIRQYDEEQRELRKKKLHQIFNKRLRPYGGKEVQDIFRFEHFWKPEYAAKRFSFAEIERHMAEFLEQTTDDLNALLTFSEGVPQSRDEIVLYYVENGSVTETINHFKEINEKKKEVAKAMEERKSKPTKPIPETTFLLRIKQSDYKKATELLSLGGIDYELV